MNRQDIQKLNTTLYRIQEATARTLELVPILFDSRARDEGEKRLYTKIADEFPELREAVTFLSTLSFSDFVDDKYSLSYMISLVRELSDRFVALKVLVNDLVPLLTGHSFSYTEVSAYYPYLSVLLDQMEGCMDSLNMWYDEEIERLRDRFEYDLREDENFQIIRGFVDRCLSIYADSHGGNPTVRSFRDYVLASLDRYADGDDDVRFTFSLERDARWCASSAQSV